MERLPKRSRPDQPPRALWTALLLDRSPVRITVDPASESFRYVWEGAFEFTSAYRCDGAYAPDEIVSQFQSVAAMMRQQDAPAVAAAVRRFREAHAACG